MVRPLLSSVLLASIVVACGGADPKSPASASSPPPIDACTSAPGSLGPAAAPPAAGAPKPAAMLTEQGAAAKRLFDQEKWAEAEAALRNVVDGKTGDDETQKANAEYWLAIAQLRQKKGSEAAQGFRAIAQKPGHPRFGETLLWLDRIAHEHGNFFQITDLAAYPDEAYAKYDNANQREAYASLRFLQGRLRYGQGDLAGAEKSFTAAKAAGGSWSKETDQCLARVKGGR